MATAPDLRCGVAPPGHRPDLGRGVAPLGRSCAVTACHSRPLPLTSSLGVASLARACAPLQPPTLVRRDSCVSHCYLVLSKFIRWSFKFPKVLCFLQILGSFDSSLSVTVFHVFRACFLSFPFFFQICFYWRIISLQYYVVFCCTTIRIR